MDGIYLVTQFFGQPVELILHLRQFFVAHIDQSFDLTAGNFAGNIILAQHDGRGPGSGDEVTGRSERQPRDRPVQQST